MVRSLQDGRTRSGQGGMQRRWTRLVAKVNTEDLPEVASRLNIRAIPTLAVFRGGQEVVRQSGVMPASSIEQLLRQATQT